MWSHQKILYEVPYQNTVYLWENRNKPSDTTSRGSVGLFAYNVGEEKERVCVV